MSNVVHDAQHEFWRPPVVPADAPRPARVEVCDSCASEFMVGSLFCHVCGASREHGLRLLLILIGTFTWSSTTSSVRWACPPPHWSLS